MRTFSEFMSLCEATGDTYDAEFRSGAQVIRTGEGGRTGRLRRKTASEIRRTKRIGGGQTAPVVQKPRKDIGKKRESSIEAPQQERGSKEVTQSYAEKVKAERRAAAKARAAAKKGGAAPAAAKPKAKDVEKQGTELLKKKKAPKPTAEPKDSRFSSSRKPEEHMIKGKYTRAEKKQLVRAGKQKLRDLVLQSTGKKKESELKHKYTGPDN